MRTCGGPIEQASNGKWTVSFETWAGKVGAEYLANTCTSAPVFDTEDEAYDGMIRALDVLAKTDRFPNMCEKF
jgi:hypothetical protein